MVLFPSSPRWHEGEKWQRLLQIYDGIAHEQFQAKNASSQRIPTTYGDTQIHTRGDIHRPILIFFHGIATNSLMFGEWLIPELSEQFYCVAMDTLGDMGRSLPRDGDPSNGPKNEQEMADWANEVIEKMTTMNNNNYSSSDQTQKRVHIAGYSLGSFIATCVAHYYPDRVDKLILMAPAGVVAPVRKLWLGQAILFAIVSSMVPQRGMVAERLRMWFFGSMMADPANGMKNLKYPELREATDAIGSPQVKVQPGVWDEPTLKDMVEKHPTLLLIGQQESVIDPRAAVDAATKSKIKVKVLANAGHMFFCEIPKETIVEEISAFLAI